MSFMSKDNRSHHLINTLLNRFHRIAVGQVFVLLVLASVIFFEPALYAATVNVNSISALNSAISSANPGDEIVLADGVYNTSSTTIRFSAVGTPGNEIVIRAETPGGVIFTGSKTFLDVTGDHQIIHGFHLKDIDTSGSWNTLVMRFMNATYNRVTNFKFENIGQGGGSTLVGIWDNSDHNEIDHSTWDGNDGVGIETVLRYYNDQKNSTHTHINHNVFKNHAPDDGSEALRLGRGGTSALIKAYMTIEYNLFENYHGDPEIFSVKSSNNIIRYNVVRNCNGGMKLRQGDNNILDGNFYFLDDQYSYDEYTNAVAIKVKGANHKVTNNYVYRASRGISLELGSPETYSGTVTSQPTSTEPFYLTDANATWSNGKYDGKYVWITSGGGVDHAYYIDYTDGTNKRLRCLTKSGGADADLRSDGVTVGSGYKINTGDPEVSNILLGNNTIINNRRNAIQSTSTTTGTFKNNIVKTSQDSSLYACYQESSGAVINYITNIAHPTGSMPPWIGSGPQPAGIVETDPNLIYDGTIWRLQSSSSNAIDSGTTDPNVTTDIDGQNRSSPPDIGSDEYSTGSIVRPMIFEGRGGAGVQWPGSTIPQGVPGPPTGLRIIGTS